jgi:two-component system chemotaxis response regulator CheY
MVQILIVDDAQFMRNILKKIFTSKGYDVIGEAETADAGVQAYKEHNPDVVTMDICMPNKSGIEAIKDIHNIDPNAKILVCSALGQELLVMEAIQAGAKDFIVKPFKKEKIIETLEKVISS